MRSLVPLLIYGLYALCADRNLLFYTGEQHLRLIFKPLSRYGKHLRQQIFSKGPQPGLGVLKPFSAYEPDQTGCDPVAEPGTKRHIFL